jgi:hypothetical protein
MKTAAPKATRKLIALAITLQFICCVEKSFSQSDPLALDDLVTGSVFVNEAFNGSYIINNQSSNVLEGGRLNFLILHRFGEISDGPFNAYGLDYASMRMGFEYGVTNKLTAAIGRTSTGKNYDAHLKYRIQTQKRGGTNNFPVSIVAFSSVAFSASERKRQNAVYKSDPLINHLVYTSELIISRQFSEQFAFEIIPAWVHRNSVNEPTTSHDIYALSGAFRLKVTERIHLTGDYGYILNNSDKIQVNPLGVGIDIVTGGHTFHVYVTNSAGMIEKEFLTATEGIVEKGNLRIGFTMSRAFILKPVIQGGKLR